MNREAEPIPGARGQVLGAKRGIVRQPGVDRLEDFVGELVPSVRAALPGQKTGQPLAPEGGLGLVEGGSGDPKSGTCAGHRMPVHVDAADHLVLHLGEIAGIEERIGLKGRVCDLLGVGVQGSVFAQGLDLLVVGGRVGHVVLQGNRLGVSYT